MNNQSIHEALEWRYATKKFDSNQKISEENWKTLEASLRLSPSSYGLQPWKFLVVQNPDIREQLKAVSWNQSQITDCSHLVVFLHKEKLDEAFVQNHLNRVAEVRNIPVESLAGYKEMMISNVVKGKTTDMEPWIQRQVYIAMGFLLETASLLKIDACPMEGLDPKEYDRILGLYGSGYKTVAVVALGYRHLEDAMQKAVKVRFPKEKVIEFIK